MKPLQLTTVIYLDNHATTPCDRRVADEMMVWLVERFGNPHSTSHEMGRQAADAVAASLSVIAETLRVPDDTVVVTSGATESNNLAIDGICRHPRQKRRHLITSTIEHPAVLDVARRLRKDGFRVTEIGVHPQGHALAGQVDLVQLETALDDDTALVSIHWANNEIGTLQPIAAIAKLAHRFGALLHSDATQAVGRLPVDLHATDVDLISASAHKFYGPKGVGLLTFGGGVQRRRVRLKPMLVGGGQQRNLRSGTMSPANVVGMATALRLATSEIEATTEVTRKLRDQLFESLCDAIDPLELNGSELNSDRLAGNLNILLPDVEGEAWMAACRDVAFSSGSACSSVDANASHVIMGLGRSESEARRSVRFGIGKFNTAAELEQAIRLLSEAYERIR
ncbi:cysteine desulfurase family protein [Roseiconus lacunae]|uniref:cysteine desulfurase family protein n=1 Tax=Roseiconus lacunae TaxID=2605694 RepID=UPI001F3F5E69|nr:cysteine desulfurase family protein [Roseiconus lacunae]